MNGFLPHRRDVLADTGPLVALLLPSDPYHDRAREVIASLSGNVRLWTVWPCVAEAAHFLGKAGGWPAQSLLRDLLGDGFLQIYDFPADSASDRIFAIMERFRTQPCDLADAALIMAAEDTGLTRVITFDEHFYAYRTSAGAALTVLFGQTR